MIPRYSRPEMTRIWEAETRFRIWFEIEVHAATASAQLGIIPEAAAKNMREKVTHRKKIRIDFVKMTRLSWSGKASIKC